MSLLLWSNKERSEDQDGIVDMANFLLKDQVVWILDRIWRKMQYLLNKSPLTCIQDERLGNVIYHADHLKAHKTENDVRMFMQFCLTFECFVLGAGGP